MIEELPGLAADYIRTINENEPAGFIALFDEDAIVDDVGRIIRGRDAIREWAASDIFAVKVTLDALDASEDESGVTITAKVDGTFDRKGLPDPLIMTFDIAFRGRKIAQLTCRLAGL
ncbi:MAG: nuclear transport factor 2 family protein [Pirellulales bacterium]